jgi:hypothetical protein
VAKSTSWSLPFFEPFLVLGGHARTLKGHHTEQTHDEREAEREAEKDAEKEARPGSDMHTKNTGRRGWRAMCWPRCRQESGP